MPRRKKLLDRLRRPVRHVDLALGEPLEQLLGRQVDELHLVGVVEDAVGDGLPHGDPGDLVDEVVEALEVLDVERGVDVDARVEQLLHVLPALGVARARGVGVGELVEQEEGGLAGEGGVEVELAEAHAPVLDLPRREPLQPLDQGGGLRPPVRLHPADDDVDALGRLRARRVSIA